MLKVGASTYLAMGKLEKLNQPPKKYPYLEKLVDIIRHSLILKEDGRYSKKEMAKYMPKNHLAIKFNPDEKFRVTAEINQRTYLELQEILIQMTGRIWNMDRWIILMINWFIFTYENPLHIKKRMPFRRKFPGKRLRRVQKFDRVFSKYYKNILE